VTATTVKAARFDPETSRLSLIVTGESVYVSQPLPPMGELVIGRAPDVDMRVDHPSISRQHAIVRVGTTITIADLGSANGTRLRGRTLVPNEPVEIRPGEVIDLGSVLLVVQPRPTVAPSRRVWTHDYFEGRLEEECVRGGRTGTHFAVLHVAANTGPDAESDAARDAILATLRHEDVLGAYAPGAFEALLFEVEAADAERIARQLVTAAARRGLALRTGIAVYPRDGSSAHALLAHAMTEATGVPHEHARVAVPSPTGARGSAMKDLHRLAESIAAGNISVLILGETGAGKEVLAEAIHRMSPRRAAPFLRLNCAALTETLLESELFGHERGAFTGAVVAKPGLLETAEGGTVFLDEVGELALSTQVKLLRVLEERQVLRVGGLKSRAIDVRFVAATNRDLEAEIVRGTYRQDLFFRISAATLVIPPLRERVGEIADLARTFVELATRDLGRAAPPAIAPEALALLESYAWPGNIRELRNMMERAVLLCGNERIEPRHLPTDKMRATLAPKRRATSEPRLAELPAASLGEDRPLRDVVREQVETLEKQRILDALARAAGNQSAAAKLLGMPRRTLVKRLTAYNVPRPRKGS
jgi:two-component system response regulator AtoC